MEHLGLKRHAKYRGLIYSFILINLITVGLFLAEAFSTHSWYYFFLFYNLLLSYTPLVLMIWLTCRLRLKSWFSFGSLLLSAIWLLFLPNSFYMVSDLLHDAHQPSFSQIYNIVLIFIFICEACLAGFVSVYMMHRELLKRLYYRHAHVIIAAIFLICSFAIYLGRYMRWSTWNIVTDPQGIVFDVSDIFLHPTEHTNFVSTFVIFYLFIGSSYILIWQLMRFYHNQLKSN